MVIRGTIIVRYPLGFILAAGLIAACAVPPPSVERRVPSAERRVPSVVFVGTSLTAGYGLPDPKLAYPALIQRKIDSLGLGYRTVNAGVSGETSAGRSGGSAGSWIRAMSRS